jgi:16S rRNA C967 or C1407 C5-methylase (RsmB/RsmF family)/NOL1/NOP2/fmu family ribosome biogenesis protein
MKPLPEKFKESIQAQLGDEFPAFLSSLQEPPPVSIRLHPVKNNPAIRHHPVPWTQLGEYLNSRPVFTLDPLLHGGSYYVQEASSMFLEQAIKQAVDLSKPLNVLDLCAAPGGKSTLLLSLLNRESLLVSNETIRTRASILAENIQKWGYPNSLVTNNDPADFKRLSGFFDVIVVDAPCSGEGLFRKDPHAMDEWSAENVQLCCSRQKRILNSSWDALRKNGILIYCTCTYNESEDEENLRWLNENHRIEFLRLSIDPSWGVREVEENGMFAYRFFPHHTRGEGFFISVIRKLEDPGPLLLKNKNTLPTPPKKVRERLDQWISPICPVTFFQFQDLIFYTPKYKAKEFEFLLQHLKIVYAGTNLARLKHDKLIPEHALALSIELNRKLFPQAEVSETDALKYLRKDVIRLDGRPSGFTLLTYKDTPIGWVNVLSNRVNNMYPSEWRIRMTEAARNV